MADDSLTGDAAAPGGRYNFNTVPAVVFIVRAAGSSLTQLGGEGGTLVDATLPGLRDVLLGAIPLPVLDAGPFLSYGIQWIAFGIIAPIGVGYFVYSEMKARRADREAAAAAQARADDASATQHPAPLTAEQKLAVRYGRRR